MLVNPLFDAKAWLDGLIEGAPVRVEHTDNDFILWVNMGDKWEPASGFQKHQDGVFWTDLNPHLYLKDAYGDRLLEYLEDHPDFDWHTDEYICSYGVADSIEQLLSVQHIVSRFVASKDKFVLCCTPIIKAHEEPYGWRWHKWGPYVGVQNPQCEYLLDEPEIEEVIVFHFYQILEAQDDDA